MGAETWATATRKITTSTNLEAIRAMTKLAHLENQPFVASHVAPASATGPKTTVTSSSALRISRENHTIPAAEMARPAKKMVTTAPTPGAAMLMVVSPAASRAIRPPMDSMVLPVACTIPMASWSVISSSSPTSVRSTKEPRTLLASPSPARDSAVGSRWISPVINWRQKKIRNRKQATPNRML